MLRTRDGFIFTHGTVAPVLLVMVPLTSCYSGAVDDNYCFKISKLISEHGGGEDANLTFSPTVSLIVAKKHWQLMWSSYIQGRIKCTLTALGGLLYVLVCCKVIS